MSASDIYGPGNVDKSAIIGDDKSGHRRNISSVSEVQSNDWSGQTAGIYVRELQANFDLVTGDLSPDDGVTCLVDTMGNRFKIVAAATDIAATTHSAASKSTPVDADEIPLVDSAASNVLKKLTWANLKAALSSTFLSSGLIREKLTANRTYYVRTDGSDSNTGLANTSGGAFLTIQRAYDVLASIDLAGFTVTVQIADGTYSAGLSINQPWSGGGAVIIQGNNTTPANVLVSTTNAHCLSVNVPIPGSITLTGMKFQTTTYGNCINHNAPGVVYWTTMEFGAATYHLYSGAGGALLQCIGNYTVTGGASMHWFSNTLGAIYCQGKTITITGAPAFGVSFAYASGLSVIFINANTFSGSATGKRYSIDMGSTIFTNGGGASYIPGNSAGSGGTSTGGGVYS